MTTTNEKLYLGLTAADMAKEISAGGDKKYWATTTANGESLTTGNHEDEEKHHVINTVTLSGGDEGVKYKCTAKFDITVSDLDDLEGQLKAEDGTLNLSVSGSDDSVTVNFANDKEGNSKTNTLSHDIKSLASPDEIGHSFWIIYEFTKTSGEDKAELKADFGITNRKDTEDSAGSGNQNYLAGKSFTVTIKASQQEGEKLDCQIVQPEA